MNPSKAQTTISRLTVYQIVLSRQSWIIDTMLDPTFWLFSWIIGLLDYFVSANFSSISIAKRLWYWVDSDNDCKWIMLKVKNRLLLFSCLPGTHRMHLSFSWLTFSISFSPIMMIFTVVWILFHFGYTTCPFSDNSSLSLYINDYNIKTFHGICYLEMR